MPSACGPPTLIKKQTGNGDPVPQPVRNAAFSETGQVFKVQRGRTRESLCQMCM